MSDVDLDEFIEQHARGRRRLRAGRPMPEVVTTSKFAHMLLELWAWGDISAYRLQQLAQASVVDGLVHPDVQKLAAIGATGKHPGNCHRDLVRHLHTKIDMPLPVQMSVPLKMDDDNVRVVDIPLLPFHRLVAHMHAHFPLEFETRIIGAPGQLQQFWANVKEEDPRWIAWSEALRARGDYQSKCFPVAFHGDGVPVFNKKSMYIVSVNSLLGTGNSMDQKFFMCGYWGHLLNKSIANKTLDTEDNVWKYIQWDIETMWHGTFPDRDANGKLWPRGSQEAKDAGRPLANGYFCVPWIFKADLEYIANVLNLEHWANGTSPCCKCKANRSDLPWTDYRLLTDPRVQWTEAEWRAAHPRSHRFFGILHCGLYSIVIDIMHTLSLGVAQHVGANVMFELIWHVLPNGSLQQRLMDIWMGIKEFYSQCHASTRMSKLTLAMITDPKKPHKQYPHLAAKAKETEWLCKALATVWPQYMDSAQPAHCHIHRTLALLVDIYDLARVDGIFHSDEDARAMMRAVTQLQAHYNWLAKTAELSGHRRWNTVMKHHMLGHIAMECQWLHVKAGATYIDEDFMGRMKTVARKCTGGMALYRLGATVIVKYTRGLYLRWSSRRAIGALLG